MSVDPSLKLCGGCYQFATKINTARHELILDAVFRDRCLHGLRLFGKGGGGSVYMDSVCLEGGGGLVFLQCMPLD